MTSREVREMRLPARGAGGALVAVAAGALVLAGERHWAMLALAALVTGASLLLQVDLPWGGRVPLGHAVVIAVAVLAAPLECLGVVAGALVVVVPFRALEPGATVRSYAGEAASLALAVGAASGAHAVALLFTGAHSPLVVVGHAVLAGVAFLGVDLVLRGTVFAPTSERLRIREAWPLQLSLLCAAALLALAYDKSVTVAPIAAVPLLVTQFSFQRYSSARATYEQTTQALSLLPEVAGLTPLGHGERTALYAARLAEELGFDAAGVDRIATAARLHHIGHISLHEPEERRGPTDVREVGRVSAELLRETGFLADLADLVERVQVDASRDGPLDAALIRVCSTLDDLAEAGNVVDPFAAALHCHPEGVERSAAIALLQLHDRDPSLVDDARAASHALATLAAEHSSHDAGHVHGDACV
ncbi:MAG TPA: HD domain-containing protein [Acidimicrobiales bacterium]|nr:HD domain-containing protein [Acidimicrobiales bacterium]